MTSGLRGKAVAALLLATFVVALAYGIALPLLTVLIERGLGAGADVGLHTGLMMGTYAFALFLFAPLWGRWSDKGNRRSVLVLGLSGFALAVAFMAAVPDPLGLYLGRFLSGGFAAAIMPVAQAMVVDWAPDDEWRGRRFAWLGIASSGGLLGGPLLGGVLGEIRLGATPLGLPLAALAATAAAAALLAALWLPRAAALPLGAGSVAARPASVSGRDLTALLVLSGVVAGGLGAFEVGVALRGQIELGLSTAQLGMVFAECMLVMVAAQALVFNPWVRARRTGRLIAPGLLLLGTALLYLPWASNRFELMLGTAGAAAGAGILLPLLAFWITLAGGPSQGRQLGRQAAAASLGQTIGSALTGLLAGIRGFQNGGFVTGGVVAVAATLFALGLSARLARLGAQNRNEARTRSA